MPTEQVVATLGPKKIKGSQFEKGKSFSGGQQQLTCIARTIATGATFGSLDEHTAKLDPDIQIQISRAIFEFSGDRTFVLIAHKLDQLRSCGQMPVLGSAPGFRGECARETGRGAPQRITTQIP